MNTQQTRRRLLDYLPAIFRRSDQAVDFFAAFEATLFGTEPDDGSATIQPPTTKGLERLIDEIPLLFDPEETTSEFLPWLAQWAALTNHERIPEQRRRQLIYRMIPLYAIRGTRLYVERVVWLHTGVKAIVEEEELLAMQVGVRSTVGKDTRMGEDPFRFHVSLDLASAKVSRGQLPGILEFAETLVNMAKPAHTHFRLTHNATDDAHGMALAIRASIGIDTVLWHD